MLTHYFLKASPLVSSMSNIELHPALSWQHFAEINSTNAYLLATDQPHNQLISADHQTAGRGRRQQTWVDDNDSLLLSLSTAFSGKTDLSAWAVQVAVTLAETLTPLTKQPITIKWPNDLYALTEHYHWGKLAGILIESSIGKNGKMVTGVGINLSRIPADIPADYPIACLSTSWEKHALIPHLGNALFCAWQDFLLSPQTNPHTYQRYDLLLGKTLKATDMHTNESHIGIGAGINEQGHLLLTLPNKTIALTSQQRIRILE